MNRTLIVSATALTMLAGTAVQAAHAREHTVTASDRASDASAEKLGFYTISTLMGTDVANANGEVVGSVGDLIVDRGTGRIEYVVLSEGGFFGIGAKDIAVPFDTFGFNHADGRFRLDVTPERIEQASEYGQRDMLELESSNWQEQLENASQAAMDQYDGASRDPFADGIEASKVAETSGTITSVNRDETVSGVEQVSVTIQSDDGRTQKVVLGPSWYVMGQAAAPMRGDTAEVSGYKLKRDAEHRIIAREAVIDDRDLLLRDDAGKPRWDVAWKVRDAEAEKNNRSVSPLLMVSDLIGMDAHARDEYGGEITDAVIEVESGKLAMLSLDPDEGFLGLGDTPRCVPLTIAAIGSDVVRIDADKDMLNNCEAMPKDVSVLAYETRLSSIYGGFEVDVAQFEPRTRRDWGGQTYLGDWSSDSTFSNAVREGTKLTVTGELRGMATVTPLEDSPDARAIRIQTDRGTRTIVLGPDWFVERQNFNFDDGDMVRIEATRVRYNGREHWIARTLKADGRELNLWKGGQPLWDAS